MVRDDNEMAGGTFDYDNGGPEGGMDYDEQVTPYTGERFMVLDAQEIFDRFFFGPARYASFSTPYHVRVPTARLPMNPGTNRTGAHLPFLSFIDCTVEIDMFYFLGLQSAGHRYAHCCKSFPIHDSFMPGALVGCCGCSRKHIFYLGIQDSGESVQMPFEVLKRFHKMPRVVVYDFACGLELYARER
jgi:hypothetical protein